MAHENDDYRKMKAACEYWARMRTLIDKARDGIDAGKLKVSGYMTKKDPGL